MPRPDLDGLMRSVRPEQEYRMFRDRCEHFIRRWSPEDLRDSAEFTAELMGLFRELQLSQSEVFTSVLTRIYAMTPVGLTMPLHVVPPTTEPQDETG